MSDMTKLPRYQSLVAWQRADDLLVHLHRVTREYFPADERYELTSQLRRAAFSVPANIVEGPPSPFGLWRTGTARHYPKETLQFLRTAWASLVETGYCLHVARRLGYITDGLYAELELELRRAAAPLVGMIRTRHAATSPEDRRSPAPSAKRCLGAPSRRRREPPARRSRAPPGSPAERSEAPRGAP